MHSGPASPMIEDLHRFPSESLHSFSFARQSEDFLHSRQNILKKSVDYMRDQLGSTYNPGLASAQARLAGDSDLQGMIDLLRKANVLGVDTNVDRAKGLGLGPLTGPAQMHGSNPFEKSFTLPFEPVEEAIISPPPEEDETPLPDIKIHPRNSEPAAIESGESPFETFQSPDAARRSGLKRTYTDVTSMSLQMKLMEALAQPYNAAEHSAATTLLGPGIVPAATSVTNGAAPAVHTHSSKFAPAPQAFFRTELAQPWTILAANDLACLMFGVTRSEVRHLGIMEVIQDDRRQWLEDKLKVPEKKVEVAEVQVVATPTPNGNGSLGGMKGGITAKLLAKASSRTKPSPRAQTDDGAGGYYKQKPDKNNLENKSRGVILCGDVVPIQRRNGAIGAASFWVMEKRGGLIWVIEEISEDVALLKLDKHGEVLSATGNIEEIWGHEQISQGAAISSLIPHISIDFATSASESSLHNISQVRHYTVRTDDEINVPTTVAKPIHATELRVSSFPHIAGAMVLDPVDLKITNANSVFSAALFGYEHPEGLNIASLIPAFKRLLRVLTEEDNVDLVDGIVVPEHSFRRARAILALREGNENAANIFLRPSGLPARHRDGSEIMVDVQLRVVRNETVSPVDDGTIAEKMEDEAERGSVAVAEVVYALWITYSRQLHSIGLGLAHREHPLVSRPITPPHQPPPPDSIPFPEPEEIEQDDRRKSSIDPDALPQADGPGDEPLEHPPSHLTVLPHKRKTIDDFHILEEMGSGAYGQVKLVRFKSPESHKMVLKYVVKKRILVDTWTRDRRLGTVPLEIHVMDFLRRDDLRHPNIVEMVDFFEDDVNYYIEMLPHGIPGMDLFDYIELRSNMEESECRNIFRQVADAIDHLHIKALVVHRDIKDENVVLDGEGRVKLIDFGSATYIKNGPFDVFVGTIGKQHRSFALFLADLIPDYAAPEVLQGRPYGGKEQDVWALGILLYTIVYKENPFYNIDEILDHPLRIPYVPFSEHCIDLIRKMLDRDVNERITIEEVKGHEWLVQET